MTRSEYRTDDAEPKRTSVRCLSSDYDGTISPLKVSRTESRVPLETRVMLGQISRILPISVITMKDLSFIMPRTPFAQAWSGIGGLEMRIGKRVLKTESLEQWLPNISLAVDYARSQIAASGIEVEDKQDSEGETIAFCVDWRRAADSRKAEQAAEQIASFCETLKLRVIRYEKLPFYDVYPVAPDKGRALREMMDELAVRTGVMYLGDSKTDNSAFEASDVSLGVVHDETPVEALDCDYFVRFERVADFLKALLANDLIFTPDLPMIEANPSRARKDNRQ